MSKRLQEIERRQEILVARSETQRGEIAWLAQNVRKPLHLIDQAMAVVRVFQVNPVLSAVAVSLFVATPRHKVLLWIGRAVTGWELYQAVSKQWPRKRP